MSAARSELDPAGLRVAEVDGLRTRYYEAGPRGSDGIVLVHGGQYGSWYSLDSWDTVLGPLAERHRVLALDRPGQGHTQAPEQPQGYRWERAERHLERFLIERAQTPVHLVGHSRGSLLVTALALRRPELVSSLTLVDAGSLAPDDPAYPRSEAFYEGLPAAPPGLPGPAAVRIEPEAQSVSPAHLTEDFVRRMVEIARLASVVEARRQMSTLRSSVFQSSLERRRADTLRAISTRGLPGPSLILWGDGDPSTPLVAGRRLEALCAGRAFTVELRPIADAGHYCFREQPGAFVAELNRFIDGMRTR